MLKKTSFLVLLLILIFTLFNCEEPPIDPPPPVVKKNERPYIVEVMNNDGHTVQVKFSEPIDPYSIDRSKFIIKSGLDIVLAPTNTPAQAWGHNDMVYLTVPTLIAVNHVVGVELSADAVAEAAPTALKNIAMPQEISKLVVKTPPYLVKARATPYNSDGSGTAIIEPNNTKVVFLYFSELINFGGTLTKNKFIVKSGTTANPSTTNVVASAAKTVTSDITSYGYALQDITNDYFYTASGNTNGYIIKLTLTDDLSNRDFIRVSFQNEAVEDVIGAVNNKSIADTTGLEINPIDAVAPTITSVGTNDGKTVIVKFSELLSENPVFVDHNRFVVKTGSGATLTENMLLEGFAKNDTVYLTTVDLISTGDKIGVELLSNGVADWFGTFAEVATKSEVTATATPPTIIDIITDTTASTTNAKKEIYVKFSEVLSSTVNNTAPGTDYEVYSDANANPTTKITVTKAESVLTNAYLVKLTIFSDLVAGNNLKVIIKTAGKIKDIANTNVAANTTLTVTNIK